jgi:hypothetical protein
MRRGYDWNGPRLQLVESQGFLPGGRAPAPDLAERGALFSGLVQYIEQGELANHCFGTWSCPLEWGCALQLTDEDETEHGEE